LIILGNILSLYERKLEDIYGRKGYVLGDLTKGLTEQEEKALKDLYFLNHKKIIVDTPALKKMDEKERQKYLMVREKYKKLKSTMEKELALHPHGKCFDMKVALRRKMIQDKFKNSFKNSLIESNYHKENIEIIKKSIMVFGRLEKSMQERQVLNMKLKNNRSDNSGLRLMM